MLHIKVADLQIAIAHQYSYLPTLCQGFITKELPPDVTVTLTSLDIEREAARTDETFPPAYMEGLACYRKIADWLSEKDGALLHGVLMEMDGCGILLCAHSGVGKSTHARMWQEAFGADRCQIINGDKPLIRKKDGKIYGYGTPWCGKEGIRQNRSVAITHILLIARGKEDKATPLSPGEALRSMMDQVYVPNTSVTARLQVLDLMNALLSGAKIFQVECTPTPNAAKVAFAAFKE